ncbi:MAG TPA: FG-GAP-like repeat-containing protein [Nocardioidaceae bacterium]|nr:FG-GAP-like repeat-containing protein [Nocardioidaceae bacterium]
MPPLVLSTFLATALGAAVLAGPPAAHSTDAAPSGPVLLAPSADREPVAPDVTEVPVPGTSAEGLAVAGAAADREGRALAALSDTEEADGYVIAGATWEPGTAPEDMVVEVRTLEGEEWTDWEPIEVHADHGPNPGSAEARNARDGSDAIVLGAVDEVQTRVTSADGSAPEDLELAVIESDPVEADKPVAVEGELTNVAATTARRPRIFSRSQWGADESLRSGSPSYGEINAGFVHHTVNANGYTRDEVPSIIRGIYAYHTRSRGWSDVGYNFLVDRFGRIWEGRYGGVSRPVIGAHTFGYNDDAFAMSAIGNFDEVRPSAAMVNAYGRLMAWKLGLHGVDLDKPAVLDGDTFAAINGHRDAASTACPGWYLYQRLDTIRRKAAEYQRPPAPPTPPTPPARPARPVPHDLAGSDDADLLLRVPHRGVIKVREGQGGPGFSRQRVTSRRMPGSDLVLVSPDLTGDGNPDLVARPKPWRTRVWPGDGDGDFGRPRRGTNVFKSSDLLIAVGDLDGDDRNDLVSRSASDGAVYLHRGNGRGRFLAPRLVARHKKSWRWMAGVGDINGDRKPDIVALDGNDGRLRAYFGDGRGHVGRGHVIAERWGSKRLVAGGVNLGMSRTVDLMVQERNGQVWMYQFGGDGKIRTRTGNWSGMKNLDRLSAVPDVTGDERADLVGRRDDGTVVVMAGNGGSWFGRPKVTGAASKGADKLLSAGDWDGDGVNDVLARFASTGRMHLWSGNGSGKLSHLVRWSGWGSFDHVVPAGDVTGDGVDDLMAQDERRRMWVYPGTGEPRTAKRFLARRSMIRSDLAIAAGQWNRGDTPDVIVRSTGGDLYLYPANGRGRLLAPQRIGRGYGEYDRIVGVGDMSGDGHPDLLAHGRENGHLWLLPGRPGGLQTRQYVGSAPKLDLLG